MEDFVKIKCPHCGAEYTLDEIYIGKYIVGTSLDVIKDPTGKIIGATWAEKQDFNEVYNCDFCKRDFSITLEIKVKSKEIDEALDFSKDTVSLI